jgi:hypothetical protein
MPPYTRVLENKGLTEILPAKVHFLKDLRAYTATNFVIRKAACSIHLRVYKMRMSLVKTFLYEM